MPKCPSNLAILCHVRLNATGLQAQSEPLLCQKDPIIFVNWELSRTSGKLSNCTFSWPSLLLVCSDRNYDTVIGAEDGAG